MMARMFFEVEREDGMLMRIDAAAVDAVFESKDKKTGASIGVILMRNNTSVRVAKLHFEQVWALMMEASGSSAYIVREPKAHLYGAPIPPPAPPESQAAA